MTPRGRRPPPRRAGRATGPGSGGQVGPRARQPSAAATSFTDPRRCIRPHFTRTRVWASPRSDDALPRDGSPPSPGEICVVSGLPEHPSVIPAVLAPVAPVVPAVHAAVDAVRDDGGGADHGGRAGDRATDHSGPADACGSKRHLRLLP